MVPKIALVTDDGLISVFNRSLAGATARDRSGGGAARRGPGFGWTSPIAKLSHRAIVLIRDAPGISEKDENRSKSTKVTKVSLLMIPSYIVKSRQRRTITLSRPIWTL